jgi:hypothetical protein
MYKNLATALRAACVSALAAAIFITFPAVSQTPAGAKPSTPVPAQPVKAGFVYVSPITEAGWTRQHDEGRNAVEAALGAQVQTTFVENVAEGADAERVIRDLAATGHQIIFTPSFGYMEPTLKVAQDFPNVKFESITGYKTAPNVAIANARAVLDVQRAWRGDERIGADEEQRADAVVLAHSVEQLVCGDAGSGNVLGRDAPDARHVRARRRIVDAAIAGKLVRLLAVLAAALAVALAGDRTEAGEGLTALPQRERQVDER